MCTFKRRKNRSHLSGSGNETDAITKINNWEIYLSTFNFVCHMLWKNYRALIDNSVNLIGVMYEQLVSSFFLFPFQMLMPVTGSHNLVVHSRCKDLLVNISILWISDSLTFCFVFLCREGLFSNAPVPCMFFFTLTVFTHSVTLALSALICWLCFKLAIRLAV